MPTNDTTAEIDISIVIATCSRVGLLRDALASLVSEAEAFGGPVEFVIVDDGSTDGTAAFLAEWAQASPVPVRVLQGLSAGVAAARNAGSFAARGTWIASFDDDQFAQAGWLRELRALADATGAAVVGGSLQLQLPEGVPLTSLGPRVRKLLGEHGPWSVAHRYDSDVLPATNNVLIRRDAFVALGGYDAAFTEGGEDKDFFDRVRAAGYDAWFQPTARAWHVTPLRRLERANLRWTSLRVGAGDARLDTRAHKTNRMVMKVAARIAALVFRDVPQWLVAGLVRSRKMQLEALCSVWFTQGYVRGLRALKSGKGEAFVQSLNFRERNGERPE